MVPGSKHNLYNRIFQNSLSHPEDNGYLALVRTGEGDGGEEEEWRPTSVTLLLVQISSLTTASPHHHLAKCKLQLLAFVYILGVCAACIRLGGKKRNGMSLQAIYLGTSIGSVLGPFIARPFLSKLALNTDNHAAPQTALFSTG